ncbi:hypothetical protein JTB14_013559 [Gonioctena quinquepunctata]|nr:hypothetical protein JTB14_013559 [Gonioctena quinquepunctata]
MLQAVCNNNLKFTSCYAGEVGAHHDASVLRRSEIWSFMREDGKFLNDTHLIGDKAYPCFPEIMTPYKDNGHLTIVKNNIIFYYPEQMYDRKSLWLIKKRFRCLGESLDVRSSQWRPTYIIACCVLHNICIIRNDVQDKIINDIENHEEENDVAIPQQIERARQRMRRATRNRICQGLNE